MFLKLKKKRTVNTKMLKLQIEMVDCLLKHRFSWDEIYEGLGFSESWYAFTKQSIEKHSK